MEDQRPFENYRRPRTIEELWKTTDYIEELWKTKDHSRTIEGHRLLKNYGRPQNIFLSGQIGKTPWALTTKSIKHFFASKEKNRTVTLFGFFVATKQRR